MPAFAILLLISLPAAARTSKGDALLAKARLFETRDTAKDLDQALKLAEEAVKTDPNDTEYMAALIRIRASAAQVHIRMGEEFMKAAKFREALAEFNRAKEIDPAPSVSQQQAQRARAAFEEMSAHPGTNSRDATLTPLARASQQSEAMFATAQPAPRLQVTVSKPIPQFRVNQQPSSEVFALLGRMTGVRVVFDPDYVSQSLGKNQLLNFEGMTVEEAFDYVALVSKSFWKPLSSRTVLIANDDPAKRTAFEEQVTKVFYLSNSPSKGETSDIANTVQRVTDAKKLMVHPEQNAIVVRTDAGRATLATKLISDLDKPKAEIIVDVLVLSVSKDWIRDLGLVLGISQNNFNAGFQPRSSLGGVAASASSAASIPLSALKRLQAGDWGITLPGAALNALLDSRQTQVLDKAQLRTVEGQTSSLKIGQRVPYATGSFTPGGVGGGNLLVNTQFSYFDVGLSLDVTAKVHEPDEVSLHIESDHSAVADRVNVGGVFQPVISQRKRVADVRVKEGEVNLWDLVTSRQTQRTTTGIPGLVNLPLVGRLFSNEHREDIEDQLLHLLVPHIIRSSDIRPVNLAPVASGSDQVVKMRFDAEAALAGPNAKPAAVTQPIWRSGPTDEIVDVNATLPADDPALVAAYRAGRPNAAPAAAAAPLSLKFDPATPLQLKAGESATVQILAPTDVRGITGLEFRLQFDHKLIDIEAVTSTGIAPQGGTDLMDDNSSTKVVWTPGASPPEGSGPLLKVVIKALQPGSTKLAIADIAAKGPNGAAMPTDTGPPAPISITVAR